MTSDGGTTIATGTARVTVRRVLRQDEPEFLRLAEQNIDYHRPWARVPTTSAQFGRYLAHFEETSAQGFLVCDGESGAIAGLINLNEIVLGPYLRGLLGFAAFRPYAEQGYLVAGLKAVTAHAFGTLGLHRLEADIQPRNSRSIKLVRGLGFVCEGLSVGFICIDGKWTDHQRWALISDLEGEQPG